VPSALFPVEPGYNAYAAGIRADEVVYVYRKGDQSAASVWICDSWGRNRRKLFDTSSYTRIACGGPTCAVLSGTTDLELHELDIETGRLGPALLTEALKHEGSAEGVDVSADGRLVAVGDGPNVWIYDRKTRRASKRTAPVLRWVQYVAFAGNDLILTDNALAPGIPALVRLGASGSVDVLVTDGAWYAEPRFDPAHHRLAIWRREFSASLHLAPIP
jgi:hypothetical protein